jgi:hypothetical protein
MRYFIFWADGDSGDAILAISYALFILFIGYYLLFIFIFAMTR